MNDQDEIKIGLQVVIPMALAIEAQRTIEAQQVLDDLIINQAVEAAYEALGIERMT